MRRLAIFKSPIQGNGVRTELPIAIGTRVLKMSGKRVSDAVVEQLYQTDKVRLNDVFEIGGGEYILLDPTPLAINHSCRPNCGLRNTNDLYALRAIQAGEELTYDYSTVVGAANAGWRMRCRCNGTECREMVGEWQSLPRERLSYYRRVRALPAFVVKELRLLY
ncbi:MAG: SET domain-containing protein [Patescibacteria group bacterium]